MKRFIALILCVGVILTICGCVPKEITPNEDIVINLPSDNTVNGYRNKETVSSSTQSTSSETSVPQENQKIQYCANTNSKVFHLPDCSSVKNTKAENKLFLSDRDELIDLGYTPCKRCEP